MGQNLNYNLGYEYYADRPNLAERIGGLYYLYDRNGNVIEERAGGHSSSGDNSDYELKVTDGVYSINYGFGLERNSNEDNNVYMRRFAWDEENRMKSSVDNRIAVNYNYNAVLPLGSAYNKIPYIARLEEPYDSSGERTVKYSSSGESLYFSEYYAMNKDYTDYRTSKNIYLGETRLATRLGNESGTSAGYAEVNTYYYHSDHLGSAQLITDYRGEEYEHIEYTPYGELWIERKSDSFDKIPFRFTGKELDEETGLYYYSARYLSPKNSSWMSADPAGVQLINPNRDNFNLIEGTNWYSYVSNNPVKYTDPTGETIVLPQLKMDKHIGVT
jgi:RHS repeat-associated protein